MGNTRHGLRYHPLYSILRNIKSRCYNANNPSYKDYGGRGIIVCDEWKNNVNAFYNWAITNGYKKGLTLDRKNNNGNYEPSNCQWATRFQQANNKRSNHYIVYNGERHTLKEWSTILGISNFTLRSRLCVYNWTIERAFTTPVKKRNK